MLQFQRNVFYQLLCIIIMHYAYIDKYDHDCIRSNETRIYVFFYKY